MILCKLAGFRGPARCANLVSIVSGGCHWYDILLHVMVFRLSYIPSYVMAARPDFTSLLVL